MLGLGAIGSRMAARLLERGHDLLVYNRTSAAADSLVAQGAKRARTPREAVRGFELAFSVVRDDPSSRSIWLNPTDGSSWQ